MLISEMTYRVILYPIQMPAKPPTALQSSPDIESIPAPQRPGIIPPTEDPIIIPTHIAVRGDIFIV
jgi:hypothetical protein